MAKLAETFLPVTRAETNALGWDVPDIIFVTADAYVDHPSFGCALLSRMLEAQGHRVAVISQPRNPQDLAIFGEPRLGFFVSSGNIDSMVAHYTVAKRRRTTDYYSPGGKIGLRPDRAGIVYCKQIRKVFPDAAIVLGGLEASLRRLGHYDYWDDKVRPSILVDSGADLLSYGMGEKSISRIAELLAKGVPIRKMRDIRGTAYVCEAGMKPRFAAEASWNYDDIRADKHAYAECFGVQLRNTDAITAKALVEIYDDCQVVINPPQYPLERAELDALYDLPFTRRWHPMYDALGGVPGLQEVEFSLTHVRGCFGGCNFCAITYHQGRQVRSRSIESVVDEARLLTKLPGFKGYIHDIGGPTADFRMPACKQQLKNGVCPNKKCLFPKPCPNLKPDHSEYIRLLSAVESVPGVKKVFIRSGIRFDYVLADKDEAFIKKLAKDHVSGHLKLAPEHCAPNVLTCMGKPEFSVYERFRRRFIELSGAYGKEQYVLPYLMSSHPGSTLADAVQLAEYLHKTGYEPEQVQDYYPTPGTPSTCMFWTGIDPYTMKPVYVAKTPHEKKLQRALLQYSRRENADLVREALREAGREDLIGYGKDCLVRPEPSHKTSGDPVTDSRPSRRNRGLKSNLPRYRQPERSKSDIQGGSRAAKVVPKSRKQGR